MNAAPEAASAERSYAGLWRVWSIAWPWLFWMLWGVSLAVLDLRNDEVQPAVLMILVGAAVLGFARPRFWWAWALGLAAWIPAEIVLSPLLRIPPAYPFNAGGFFLPPIPALIGAACGAGLRRAKR